MAIDPNLVSIIPASELPTGVPTTAGQFFFYEGNEMKKSPMTEIYQLISGLKGTLKITDTAPTVQGLYILSDVGTYTNLGGLVTTTGKVNYAFFDGTAWKLIAIDGFKENKRIYIKDIRCDKQLNNGALFSAPNKLLINSADTGVDSFLDIRLQYYGIGHVFKSKTIKINLKYKVSNLNLNNFANVTGATVNSSSSSINGNILTVIYNVTIGSDLERFQAVSKVTSKINSSAEASLELIACEIEDNSLSDDEVINLQNQLNKGYFENIINVDKNFNIATPDFGWKKFNSIVKAHNSIKYSGELNRFIIKIADGEYDEFNTLWGSTIETTDNYIGIIVKNFVFFDGNTFQPENCKLIFDGASNIPSGSATYADLFKKCIFHITSYDGNFAYNIWNTKRQYSIQGFYFDVKNARYCIHPESSGQGYYTKTYIGNCKLKFGLRPALTYLNNNSELRGSPLAMGLTRGEEMTLENITLIKQTLPTSFDPNQEGISYHNNAIQGNTNYPLPQIEKGNILRMKNVNMGGLAINCYNIVNDGRISVVYLENVANAKRIYTYYTASATYNAIKVVDLGFDGAIEKMP